VERRVLFDIGRFLFVGTAAEHDALEVVDHVWVGREVLLLASSVIAL
jgi:hypothetical protein